MHQKNYGYLILVLFLGLLTFFSSVNAHNPSNMILEYNINTDDLSVTITHNVVDVNSHYIKTVIIKVNSSTIINQTYTSQPSTSTFTYHYTILADVGDSIEATAFCSITGSITRSLEVSSGISTTNGEPVISGYLGVLIICLISIFIVIRFKYRKLKRR